MLRLDVSLKHPIVTDKIHLGKCRSRKEFPCNPEAKRGAYANLMGGVRHEIE